MICCSEEAKRAWERQEEKWAKEQRARDALMKEVLDTVGKQVTQKLIQSSNMTQIDIIWSINPVMLAKKCFTFKKSIKT